MSEYFQLHQGPMSSNLLPSVEITPLYQEILEVVKTYGKTKEVFLDFVSDRVKTTKHSSRVRLALEALVELKPTAFPHLPL